MNPTSSCNIESNDDPVLRYLRRIGKEYNALKSKLAFCQNQILALEAENERLKLVKCSGCSSSSSKRRKTDSCGESPTLSSASASLLINESKDQFNNPILDDEDGSSANTTATTDSSDVVAAAEENEDDEDVILATPQPIPISLGHSNKQSRKHRSKPPKLSDTNVDLSTVSAEVITFKSSLLSPKKEQKPEQLSPSPLRQIDNKLWHSTTSNIAGSKSGWISCKTPIKQHIKVEKETPLTAEVASPATKTPTKLGKSPPAKNRLSLNKKQHKKQATLKFSTMPRFDTSAMKSEDMDETFCGDLNNSKNKSERINGATLKLSPKKEEKENYGLRSKPVEIKVEPPSFPASNSSSVFAVPNETDEIIDLDDSQIHLSFPTSQDLLDHMPYNVDEAEQKFTSPPLRTEYRQRPTLRTKEDKAAQPGFMCPDCAPWFKMMGAALNDREIQRRLDACSKHRKDMALPNTPEGFWVPYFEDTPVDNNNKEQSMQYRLKSRQDIIRDSQLY